MFLQSTVYAYGELVSFKANKYFSKKKATEKNANIVQTWARDRLWNGNEEVVGVSIDWAESLQEDVTVGSHPKRAGFVVGSKLHL